MGNFYTNTLVSITKYEDVKSYLIKNGRNCILIKSNKDSSYFMFTDEICDSQDVEENNKLLRPLSKYINDHIMACIVHDSSILMLCLFDNGEDSYDFNSNPSYFKGKSGPIVKKIDVLIDRFNADKEKLIEIHSESFIKKCVFAEELQKAIYKELELPIWSIGIGYMNLTEDDDLYKEFNQGDYTIEKV